MMQFEEDGCVSFLHTSVSTLNAAQLVCGELNPKANSATVSKDDAPVPKAQTNTIIHGRAKLCCHSQRLKVNAS